MRDQPEVFRDHFSGASREYAAYRPSYPPELYAAIAELAPGRRLAWDCATGSGQAAIGLAEHFDRVIATDQSGAQLAAALPHERIEYRHASAEESGLPGHAADVIAVAQALHWFDLPRFYREARRVLVAKGVLAAWGYGRVNISTAIDALLERFYTEDVGPWWPPERKLVDGEYAAIPFPFAELAMPRYAIERDVTLAELTGYLRTWSATQRYLRERGSDPVLPLERELETLWGKPERTRRAVWPIFMRIGRV